MDDYFEQKIEHLHKVLDTVRNINKVLFSEKDPKQIIKSTCEILVNVRQYHFAWIVLFDKNQNIINFEKAGQANGFEKLKEQILAGNVPKSYKQALKQKKLLILDNQEKDCPLAFDHKDWSSFIMPLQMENNIYGIICAAVPNKDAKHPKEKETFENIANDIANALLKIKEQNDYLQMFNDAPDGFVALDEKLNILNVNQAFCKIVEIEKELLVGVNGIQLARKMFSGEMLMRLLNAAKNLFSGKEVDQFEVDLKNKTLVISTNFKSLSKYRIATIRDITLEKQHKEFIKRSENKFKNLMGNLPGMAYSCLNNKNWDMSFMSEGCFDLLGYYPYELIDNDTICFDNLIHPEDSERVWKEIQEATKKNITFEIEYRIISKSGEEKWVWERGKKVTNEKKVTLEGFITDITERKELEQKNQMFSKAIESSPVSIAITDADGIIEYINPFFTEKTGYSLTEVLGKTPSILKSGKQDNIFYKNLWKTILEGKIWTGEFHNKKKNGELYWEQASISPIYGSNGNIEHFIAVKEDITERKETHKELNVAKEKAEESDRLKSAFLANMSHEIRTPMNGILGFTDLLKEPNLTGDEQKQFIDIIQKSGERMLNTINDIIDISKIESGVEEIYLEDIELHHFLYDLYLFFELEAKSKGLQLLLSEDRDRPIKTIQSDHKKLSSILINLLKNAIKFTHNGRIEFGYKNCGNAIEFFVSDTGVGIPKERQHAIFDRFVQADISDSRVFEGSGLGLAIIKSYTEMLHGKVVLKSEQEKGTKFTITIPFTNQQIQAQKAAEDSSVEKTKQMEQKLKILIVEDDSTSIKYLSLIVNKLADEILVAENGLLAVQCVEQNPDIDIILMDIKMPVMDGYTATRKIREFNSDVLIIAQTAFAQADDSVKSINAGCDDYITKPINKKKLHQTIQDLVAKTRNKNQ